MIATLTTLVSFVIVIGIIIFIHELGHFFAAKLVGIKVEQFSLGFPPKIVGKQWGETEYRLSWVPLGGYVKLAGMVDESLGDESTITGAAWEFQSKNVFQKTFVLSAGVLANFILAIGGYAVMGYVKGIPQETVDPVAETVSKGSPAEEAGLQPGSRIVRIEGQAVDTWEEMTGVIYQSAGVPLRFQWEHEGEVNEAVITPEEGRMMVGCDIREVGLIGITPAATVAPGTFFAAIGYGFDNTVAVIKMASCTLKLLIQRKAHVSDLAGPVRIAEYSGQAARAGLDPLLYLIFFLSANIGFINILPIPVLDGGHLVYAWLEAIIRRQIPVNIKLRIQQVGMVIIIGFMLLIIFSDIREVFFR